MRHLAFSNLELKNKYLGSSQDGGVGRNPLLPHTTKRRITTNLKTINNQKCQRIKLHGTLTTKELKKHSPRQLGGTETGSWVGGEEAWHGRGLHGQGGAG